MTNPMIKIVNVETGEEIEREMNAQELAQFNKDAKEKAEHDAAKEVTDNAKAALLAKLGITAEEAALLLG